ncbi:MAG: aminotransferase class I/II-fold pyridoxal phosphate-dependent enzyme [Fimbriimonadaceae bacterium]|nr:aminotransferase class I/II-fold pyridoxal phosphate-dependent enzyme [Fimbriimonadaceae bacterium]QYK57121.1 MAG: aminotransferase class I/II-fold pyridoxal phosphate-dependent enzyme [Fimbriimonadaceae bacterium]
MRVDLRSDTVTRPTPSMYEAMMAAELGDDVLGHDPTVEKLERLAADLTGKEAAIFVPSGTMGNQVALATHTNPGESVLFEDEAHMLFYEGAAPSVFAGVQARTVPSHEGVVDPDALASRVLRRSEHTPGTTLLCLENTHNRAGGTVTSLETHRRLRQAADELGIKVHLDGARVFNAAVALGAPVDDITRTVDSVSFCLSKGLCSPVGSVLCGTADFISEARYWRKRMGGGLRQAGILAACGIVSLTQMVDRLAEDHDRCRRLAESLDGLPGLSTVPPQTNILMVDTVAPADRWEAALREKGVDLIAMGPNRLRAVFHHDVEEAGLALSQGAFRELAELVV